MLLLWLKIALESGSDESKINLLPIFPSLILYY